jgi:hypothetical protein
MHTIPIIKSIIPTIPVKRKTFEYFDNDLHPSDEKEDKIFLIYLLFLLILLFG